MSQDESITKKIDSLSKLIQVNVQILRGERVDRNSQMEAIEVLEKAVWELGHTGQEQVVDALAELLEEMYDAICTTPVTALGAASPIGRLWSLVKVTIGALGETGSERAVDPLVKVLGGKEGTFFKRVCIEALGKISCKVEEDDFLLLLSKLRAVGHTSDSEVVKEIREIRNRRENRG